MRYSISLINYRHLDPVAALPVSEVALHTKVFSLEGQIGDNELENGLDRLKTAGKAVYLVWDIFGDDSALAQLITRLRPKLNRIDGVRFMDPGVGRRLQSAFPDLALHFVMSHGQLNRAGIIRWAERFRPQLSRVVLSNQIPLDALPTIIPSLGIDVEIAGAGPQVWCYSRRSLLGSLAKFVDTADGIGLAGHDRPRQPLTAYENRHGTFIYGDRDLFLLDRLAEIEAAGVSVVGLKLQTDEQLQTLAETFPKIGWQNRLKARWGAPVSPGFLDGNPTGEVLTVLVNPFLQTYREARIGTVIEAVKNSHLLLSLRKTVPLPVAVEWVSPDHKRIEHRLLFLKDLSGRTIRNQAEKGLYLAGWIKHVVPGTLLLRTE